MGKTIQTALDPTWLTGPIFDKELRVSSRRRKNYTLRFFYILILTVFIAVVWLGVVEMQGNATVQQSRMAVAGKQIVSTVVIFQFVAMQILAVVMLSNAVSDEVYHRTLGLLMTTPINGLQIVMGKVLSRLLQWILLLGITLPILAIVRVFGGVSWGYLLSSLAITLTAAIFAGSFSLLLSIENRHSYAVIVRTMAVLGCFYAILPLAIGALWGSASHGPLALPSPVLTLILVHVNPIVGIWVTTQNMLSPGGTGFPFFWPVQCAALLGLSALVLAYATVVVRKVALRQATGQLDFWSKHRVARAARRAKNGVPPAPVDGPIKRVQGPPVVWRELRAPFIQGVDNRNSRIGLAVTVGALVITYITCALTKCLHESFSHGTYLTLFIFLGTIINVIYAATRITTEKESQSWLLLMATPLSDGEILFGKAVSVFRRCLPIWGLLAGHVLLFVLVGYIHYIAVLYVFLLVAWLTCFITGAGLYFGARFARTTSAVVASFALILGLWVLGPILAGLLQSATHKSELPRLYAWTHPMVQVELISEGAAGRQNARESLRSLEFGGVAVLSPNHDKPFNARSTTAHLALVAAGYGLAGGLFFWRARLRLRKHIFL